MRYAVGPVAVVAGLDEGLSVAGDLSAHAFGYGPPDEGYRHDGEAHTFCYFPSSTSRIRRAALGDMKNLERQTNLGISGPLDYAGRDGVRFGLATQAVDGDWVCDEVFERAPAPGGVWRTHCSKATVRINPSNVEDDIDWKQTSCHELGHSVGLRHGGAVDCIMSRHATTSHLSHSSHHILHINNQG